MADFLIADSLVAKNEGGYQCDPDDNGNWTGGHKNVGNLVGTNFGITARLFALYLKREPTIGDMRNMSIDTARLIRMKNYWNPLRGNEINSQEEANRIYDAAINMGTETAIILAQRDLNLHETGIMDKITIDHLNNKA